MLFVVSLFPATAFDSHLHQAHDTRHEPPLTVLQITSMVPKEFRIVIFPHYIFFLEVASF